MKNVVYLRILGNLSDELRKLNEQCEALTRRYLALYTMTPSIKRRAKIDRAVKDIAERRSVIEEKWLVGCEFSHLHGITELPKPSCLERDNYK